MDTAAALAGKRILVTGVTGWVAGPLAAGLAAAGNTVFGGARFADPAARQTVLDTGVTPVSIDLGEGRFDEMPADLDLVLHFAVSKAPTFPEALRTNAEGAADLFDAAVARSDSLAAFFHCSSTAVYEPAGHEPRAEADELGESHKQFGMTTYSVSKIAAEACVAQACRRHGVPTVIARLCVPYGEHYGWMLFHLMMMEHGMPIPVYVDSPTQYKLIHARDQLASLPYLLGLASVPATTVNWASDEVVSVEDWCTYFGELTGLTPTFNPTTKMIPSVVPDVSKLNATGFRASVAWRDGLLAQLRTTRPDLLKEG